MKAKLTMNRLNRRSTLAAVAAIAAAAGAGFAWREYSLSAPQEAALTDLWALNLELPQGGNLALESLRGKPTVLNFWATWCPPCVDELPLLERFYRQNKAKNWQVIGIAVDNAKAVQKFLGQMPLSFPVPLAGLAGTELSRSLGNMSGGLPFTVVVNAAGSIALRHMGKLSAAQVDNFLSLA